MTGRSADTENGPLAVAGRLLVEVHVSRAERTLGIISAMYCSRDEAGIYAHTSFGRVIDRLAARYRKVLLCMPAHEHGADASRDYQLMADNIELVPQPAYKTTLGALPYLTPIVRAYGRVCRQSDAIFVRGLIPYVGAFYLRARWEGRRPCQWIIGNPIALLRASARNNWLRDTLSIAYAWQNQLATRWGRWLTGGAFVCNGAELGQLFNSPRTEVTVSSTISDEEFHERADTCQGDRVRMLFVGFPRPEKGLQYLIEALSCMTADRPSELTVVGAEERFAAYRAQLEAQATALGVADRIRWTGYVPYGPELLQHLRDADIFVLPTLSEGTPRVLVEARANSLPVVASRVGGIPTSVTDGVDGLLVPPKDPAAIAAALDRIIMDGDLRRGLIRAGLRSARTMTVDRFVDRVASTLES